MLSAGLAALVVNLMVVSLTPPGGGEAMVRVGIARDLHGPTSRGFHALIDSVLFAPLPTVAVAPLVGASSAPDSPWAFYLLTSVLSALCLVYLTMLARVLGRHWAWGAAAAVVLLLNPWTPLAAWRGTSATGTLLILTAACFYLSLYLRHESLGALAALALVLALGITWDVRLGLVALAGAGLVAGRAAVRPEAPREGRLESALWVYLTPVVYVPGVWVLFNWLVFGDAIWFVRSLPDGWGRAAAGLVLGAVVVAGVGMTTVRWPKAAGAAPAGLFLVGTLALLGVGLAPQSPESAALVGPRRADLGGGETAQMARYLRESRGGRLLLVVGKPGYVARQAVGEPARLVHHLELDPDAVLRDTPGRQVYAILTQAQVEWWKRRLGAERWDRSFFEDAEFGQWRVFYCLRPAAQP